MTENDQSLKEFFIGALDFLKNHQWIYNYPNTHILFNKVLDKIPHEWRPYLRNISIDELNNIPSCGVHDDMPESLLSFLQKIQSLKYDIKSYQISCHYPELPTHVHLTPKKAHEIVCLAAVVNDVCSKLDLKCIIDVGAGLGYLSYLLHEKYNYNILAIEGNPKIYASALEYQTKHYSSSKSNVKYAEHFVTSHSLQFIKNTLHDNFNKDLYQNGVCITGLHACADLSVTILKIFRELEFIKCIVIMPCCYHRLEVLQNHDDIHKEQFRNFPISDELKRVYADTKGSEFLKRFFLRLSCQQTQSAWRNMTEEEHMKHSISCMFRAVVQEVAEEENCIVKRRKRKTGKPRMNCTEHEMIQQLIDNFESSHELLPVTVELCNNVINYSNFKSRLWKKWNDNKDDCRLIEALTAFQTAIQSLCENVVLLDRVSFLGENGMSCNLYKVADDNISPRCHALIATKS